MTPRESEYRTPWLIAHNGLHDLVWGKNPKVGSPPATVDRKQLDSIWREYVNQKDTSVWKGRDESFGLSLLSARSRA